MAAEISLAELYYTPKDHQIVAILMKIGLKMVVLSYKHCDLPSKRMYSCYQVYGLAVPKLSMSYNNKSMSRLCPPSSISRFPV